MSISPNNFLKHPIKLSILNSILLKYQFFLIFFLIVLLFHILQLSFSLFFHLEKCKERITKFKCTIKARVYLHNDYENAFYTVDEGTNVSNF